jgi:small-conductance mechanosensitive channel
VTRIRMLDNLTGLLTENTSLSSPWGRLVVIVAVFALAWLVARATAWMAGRILVWHDRRQSDTDLEATGKITNLKRRETLVSVIRTGITYVTFAVAAVVAIGQLTGGVDRLTAIAGASFALILAGFATQRILVDIIAGLTMFDERWFSSEPSCRESSRTSRSGARGCARSPARSSRFTTRRSRPSPSSPAE